VKLSRASARDAATSAADLLSNPSTWISRAPAAAFRRVSLRFRTVWGWVVVGALPTGGGTACHCQPSQPDVVHDHTRLHQHQMVAIACVVVAIGARHMKHAGTVHGLDVTIRGPSPPDIA
jgi:hypothetical protein